jgi:hypothetical protein
MTVRYAPVLLLLLPLGALRAQEKSTAGLSSAALRMFVKPLPPAASPVSRVAQVDGTDARLTNDSAPENETTIAVNPFNINQIVGGMNDYGVISTGYGGNGVVYSTDGGATWTHHPTGVPMPVGFANAGGDPGVCWNSTGRVFYSFIASGTGATDTTTNNGVFLSSSTDGGVNWSTPVAIASNVYSGTGLNFEDKIYCAADDNPSSPYANRIYVSWTRFYIRTHPNGGTGGGDIMSSYSTDSGASWSTPVIVSSATNEPANVGTGSVGSSYVQGSEPEVARNGNVYIAYWMGGRIDVSRSTDGGATWGVATQPFGTGFGVASTNSPLPFESFRVNSYPNIETDPTRSGYVYVVANDASSSSGGAGRDNGGDIIFARSTDYGATWEATRILNDDISGNDQVFPWMAVSTTGIISAIWYDTRNSTTGNPRLLDVYGTYSTDGGTTWATNLRVTDVSFNPNTGSVFSNQFFGDYNGLAAGTNDRFHPLWTDNRDGSAGHQEIYYDYFDVSYTPVAATPGQIYGSTGSTGSGVLTSINTSTGAGTYLGPTGIGSLPGLAISSTGAVYGSAMPGASSLLYRIDGNSGAAFLVGSTGISSLFDALAFGASDVLYGLTQAGNLYTINTTSAAVTLLGSTGLSGWAGLAFDPTNGDLYGSMGAGAGAPATPDQIYRINRSTAASTLVGTTGLGGGTPDLAFLSGGLLYGVKDGAGASPSNLISINKSTALGALIGSVGFRAVSGMGSGLAVPLPVELASFTAEVVTGGVRLVWETLSETNNYGFEIERRVDGAGEYASLPGAFVAGRGTTLKANDYAFVDSGVPAGILWYRLKQIDLDGTAHYSEGVEISGGELAGLPGHFELLQNYPNPCNPSTTIRYGLPRTSEVSFHLYNTLGEEVRSLRLEAQPAGYHEIRMDFTGLPTGIYFYRLRAGEFTAVKKLILAK